MTLKLKDSTFRQIQNIFMTLFKIVINNIITNAHINGSFYLISFGNATAVEIKLI